ncbi:MAG: hypothetical protein ACU84H_15420 [Gammaproteobacteria bacterium]
MLSHLNTATVVSGCSTVPNSYENIAVLRAPTDLTFGEAATFTGKPIDAMLSRSEPFLVVIPDYSRPKEETFSSYLFSYDLITYDISPCSLISKSCVIIVTNPQIGDSNNEKKIKSSEIISIDDLRRKTEPEPLWNMALPFAFLADTVFIIIVIMAVGGGRPAS